jgi:hypothetical protein
VQIVTNEPLLECRVLASVVGPTRDEAIRLAMVAAGVTELAEGDRPRGAIAYTKTSCSRVIQSASLLDALAICGEAVDGLIGASRRARGDHIWYKCDGISCRDGHCVYCEGGLAYCVVCQKGEIELEPRCPGPAA